MIETSCGQPGACWHSRASHRDTCPLECPTTKHTYIPIYVSCPYFIQMLVGAPQGPSLTVALLFQKE